MPRYPDDLLPFKEMQRMNQIPIVSVIVTTKNEEKNIENCLKSIKSQTYLNNLCNQTPNLRNKSTKQSAVEIIVVDNNSTDNTVEIAKKFTDKVYNKGPERSAQRNFGVRKAKGKYILYLDADMTLSKNVIFECIEKCEKEGCTALYIPERIVNLSSNQLNNLWNQSFHHCNHSFYHRNQPFWVKVRDFERSFYNATVIDCVRFVRRDKFLKIDGFDLSLTGPEDWDFDRRIKATGKVDIINTPLYHNEGKFNIRKYLKKKNYYSKSFDKYIKKWSHIDSFASDGIKVKTDPIIKKQFGLWYRYFRVFLENGKWKKLIKHPISAVGVYLLRLLVGLYYIRRK